MVANPFIFCPFNAGPRICIGQQFAYNEASFFLIRLIQQFTSFSLDEAARLPDAIPKPEWAGIRGPQGRDRIRFHVTLTMFVRGGLWMKMEEVHQ
ncbi:Protein kinase alk2 [Leucoagaricus gongylophorus]